MTAERYVLDTSALLAHYFDEPGAEEVGKLWSSGQRRPSVSAVTVVELRTRLHAEVSDHDEAAVAAHVYLDELTVCIPADRPLAELAWQLKSATPGRLPLADALIAATARATDAVLVHRDPHMAAIPKGLVRQMILPEA